MPVLMFPCLLHINLGFSVAHFLNEAWLPLSSNIQTVEMDLS